MILQLLFPLKVVSNIIIGKGSWERKESKTYSESMASYIFLHTICILSCLLYIAILAKTSSELSCQHSPSKFLTQPTNRQIRRGEDAVFHCSVPESNHQTKSLVWKIYPNPHTKPVITYIYDENSLISNITIPSSLSHGILYLSCIVKETIQDRTLCFSSKEVVMDTIYFPMQDELVCNPLCLSEMNIGETLSVICTVPRGNPPVDLSWKVFPAGQVLPPSLNDEGSLRVLTHELSVTRNLHMKIFRCKVSSEFSFPGEKLQCSVGPIMIRHPPEVHIFPQTKSIKLLEQIELSCTADAYPEVDRFTWTCFPEGVMKGCDFTTSSRHSFMPNMTGLCVSKVKAVHIICSASNQEGIGKGYAYLEIADNITTCRSDYVIPFVKGNTSSESYTTIGDEHQKQYTTEIVVSTNVPSPLIFQDGSQEDSYGTVFKPLPMMVISGVMLSVGITMAAVSLCLYRVYYRKARDDKGSLPDPKAGKTEYSTNVEIAEDPFYEIPLENPLSTDETLRRFNQNPQEGFSGNSHSDHRDESPHQQSSLPSHAALYENKEQVKVHLTKGKSIKTPHSKAKRQQVLKLCEEYPMPKFPMKHGN